MLTAEEIKYRKISLIVATIMLLLGVLPWDYFYYQILRIVITATTVLNAYLTYKLGKERWMWFFVVLGTLYNPLFPISITKDFWTPLNIVSAVIIYCYLKQINLLAYLRHKYIKRILYALIIIGSLILSMNIAGIVYNNYAYRQTFDGVLIKCNNGTTGLKKMGVSIPNDIIRDNYLVPNYIKDVCGDSVTWNGFTQTDNYIWTGNNYLALLYSIITFILSIIIFFAVLYLIKRIITFVLKKYYFKTVKMFTKLIKSLWT